MRFCLLIIVKLNYGRKVFVAGKVSFILNKSRVPNERNITECLPVPALGRKGYSNNWARENWKQVFKWAKLWTDGLILEEASWHYKISSAKG